MSGGKLHLDGLLAESDLSNLAFTLVERFSTQSPLELVMAHIFNTIGSSLQSWCNADFVSHVFCNPDLQTQECHVLRCRTSTSNGRLPVYEALRAQPAMPTYAPVGGADLWKPRAKKLPADREDPSVVVSVPHHEVEKDGHLWISQLAFANGLPLGHFCVAWRGESQPVADHDIIHLQSVLWSLGRSVSRMLLNHYPIHSTTYLPSFWQGGEKKAAILFADIRNSTPLLEIARLGGEKHIHRVEALLQAWLCYAAQLITQSGIGRIQRFSGDGFMATFGEYVIPTRVCSADEAACILALHCAKLLAEAFDKLYSAWRTFDSVREFYSDHNEDVDLCLGIGVNYGKIYFGYYGVSCYCSEGSPSLCACGQAGHLEFTAIGDHVNTAQRLESIASKASKAVDLDYRCERFKDQFHICPIVTSQTVSVFLPTILDELREKTLKRRGVAHLKGKGSALPFFEVRVEDIRPDKYQSCLKGISADHYFTQLINPPQLSPLLDELKARINRIDSESRSNGN